jgi:hypothetical protein
LDRDRCLIHASANWESSAGYLAKWWDAHHRINPENAYFYRANANSKIAVTLKVTPVVAAEERASRGV